jgi:hypothetical protein
VAWGTGTGAPSRAEPTAGPPTGAPRQTLFGCGTGAVWLPRHVAAADPFRAEFVHQDSFDQLVGSAAAKSGENAQRHRRRDDNCGPQHVRSTPSGVHCAEERSRREPPGNARNRAAPEMLPTGNRELRLARHGNRHASGRRAEAQRAGRCANTHQLRKNVTFHCRSDIVGNRRATNRAHGDLQRVRCQRGRRVRRGW